MVGVRAILVCVVFDEPASKMILGFLWEYSTAFSASELLPQVSPQPEFLPVSRNISLTGSISLAAKSFHILVLFPLSLLNLNSSFPSLPTTQLLLTEVEVDLLRREEMHNCTDPEQH